jgi:hypothetical protein
MSLSGPRTVISDLELMNWNHLGLDMRYKHDSKLLTCARTRCSMAYVLVFIRQLPLKSPVFQGSQSPATA